MTYCNLHDRQCRRYRTALIGVGKKNGKSELAAALALYFLVGDGEQAPLVPCAAAGDDQADIVFGAASTMASMSPTLSQIVSVFEDRIIVPEKPGSRAPKAPRIGWKTRREECLRGDLRRAARVDPRQRQRRRGGCSAAGWPLALTR